MDRTIETTAGELPELIRKYRLAATERVRVTFDSLLPESHLTENGLTPEEEDDILRAADDDDRSPAFSPAFSPVGEAITYLHSKCGELGGG
jgi:hypothetical protein